MGLVGFLLNIIPGLLRKKQTVWTLHRWALLPFQKIIYLQWEKTVHGDKQNWHAACLSRIQKVVIETMTEQPQKEVTIQFQLIAAVCECHLILPPKIFRSSKRWGRYLALQLKHCFKYWVSFSNRQNMSRDWIWCTHCQLANFGILSAFSIISSSESGWFMCESRTKIFNLSNK